MKMLSFIAKAAACAAALLAFCCKPEDPAAVTYLVPEFNGVEVDESVPGSVSFICSVSSMTQLSEYGMYVTPGGSTAGTPAEGRRIEGRRLSDSSFAVSLQNILGGATYSCSFFIGNGRMEVLSEPVVYYAPRPADRQRPMRLKVRTSEQGLVSLPLRGEIECLIDWGDGTKDQVTADYGYGYLSNGNVSHSYAAQGEYEVSVSGSVTALSSVGLSVPDCVLAVLDWGETGLEDLSCAFLGQKNLDSVADPDEDDLANVASVREAFSETALAGIPAGLFDGCPADCDYTRVFAECERLTSIPEALFPQAVNLTQCFSGCTALESLPEKLLQDGRFLKMLQETFAGCTSLAVIPEGIFSGCPDLERMVSTFRGCTALKSVPASLFDANRKLSVIEGLFMNCSSLCCESPYTVTDGTKVHLYERENCPDTFNRIESGYLSFFGCTAVTDYSSLPINWKKP